MRLRHQRRLLALSLLLLGACRPAAQRMPGEFRWADTDPEYIDPLRVSESVGWQLAANLFEGLTCQPASSGQPLPCGAQSWDTSPNGLVWTFHLRPEARWSDGRPITSADYIYTLHRMQDPDTAAPYRFLLDMFEVPKVRNLSADSIPIDPNDPLQRLEPGLHALDDHTLVFRLGRPVTFLDQLVSMPAFSPTPKDLVEAWGDDWTRPEHIISNGAYLLKEIRPLDRIVLDKNPLYWDAASVQVPRATQLITDNDTTAYRMYTAGEIDWLTSIRPSYLSRLRKVRPDELRIDPLLGINLVLLNLEHKPLDDERVRRALSASIDRRAMVNFVTQGGEQPLDAFVPDLSQVGYTSPSGLGYSPQKARELLSDAGFPNGAGFPTLVYSYNTVDLNRRVAEALQQMWKTNLNINVRLENMEWKVYVKRQRQMDFDLSRMAWIGDYIDPMTFLRLFETGDPNNRVAYSSSAYDGKLGQARMEPNPSQRMALIWQAERLLLRDVPAIPLFTSTTPSLLKKDVTGFGSHMQDTHLFKYLRIPLERTE